MSTEQLLQELESLPGPERLRISKRVLEGVCPEKSKLIERLIRRIENPDIPEDVWLGIEDAEDRRLVDMETALSEKPPSGR